MKPFIAILLASVILFQSASKLAIVIDFELNKDLIIAKFCENKAKPKMHCNGKCHFKKQLQKEDKKEKQQNTVKEKSEIQFYSHSSILIEKHYCNDLTVTDFNLPLKSYSTYLLSVFHPPPISVI